ncbi:hypothetical protein GF362_00170 [Candidatus Dojkabacteria bacterium]|nr:hypothetical protein [Candidatus Dojkabacteria bacterium]
MYRQFSSQYNKFVRFDFLFVFQFIFFVLGRVWGILLNLEDYSNIWTINPLMQQGEQLYFLNSWPWFFLKVWDGNFNINFIYLFLIIALSMTLFIFRKKITTRSHLFNVFSYSVLIAFSISLVSSIVLSVPILGADLTIFSLNSTFSYLIINILILIIIMFIKQYDRSAIYFVIIYIFWGLFSLFIRLAHKQFNNDFWGIDFYYLESFICLAFPIIYFIYVILRQNLAKQRSSKLENLKNLRLNRKARPRVNYSRIKAGQRNNKRNLRNIFSKFPTLFKKKKNPRES